MCQVLKGLALATLSASKKCGAAAGSSKMTVISPTLPPSGAGAECTCRTSGCASSHSDST